jgi:hypothetical protein
MPRPLPYVASDSEARKVKLLICEVVINPSEAKSAPCETPERGILKSSRTSEASSQKCYLSGGAPYRHQACYESCRAIYRDDKYPPYFRVMAGSNGQDKDFERDSVLSKSNIISVPEQKSFFDDFHFALELTCDSPLIAARRKRKKML